MSIFVEQLNKGSYTFSPSAILFLTMADDFDSEILDLADGGGERPSTLKKKRSSDDGDKSSKKRRVEDDSQSSDEEDMDIDVESEDGYDPGESRSKPAPSAAALPPKPPVPSAETRPSSSDARPLSGGVSLGGSKAKASSSKPANGKQRHPLPAKPGSTSLYPLEGKYVDEDDRDRLLDLPEIEREEILAGRLEEQQAERDRQALEAMYRERVGSEEAPEEGRGARRKTAKDEPKSAAMAALQERRKAKSEGKTRKPVVEQLDKEIFSDEDEGPSRRGGRGDDDYYTDSDEEEDIRPRRNERQRSRSQERRITHEDINRALLFRRDLAEFKHRTFFDEMLRGAYVKFPVGVDEQKRTKYRVHEVEKIDDDRTVTPYMIEHKGKQIPDNRRLVCHYGSRTVKFKMSDASNQPVTEMEAKRWILTMQDNRQDLPTSSAIDRKAGQLADMRARPVTDAEIKNKLKAIEDMGVINSTKAASVRNRLEQERQLAYRRNDMQRVREIERELEAVGVEPDVEETDAMMAKLAKVNEKNKSAALAQSRRAHRAEQERKKALEEGAILDPSARVRTRLKQHDASIPKALREADEPPAVDLSTPHQENAADEPAVVMTESGDVAVEVDLGDF